MIGVAAQARDPFGSAAVLESLGFQREGDAWRTGDETRSAVYGLEPSDGELSIPGAGTIHHVAWASLDEDHQGWLMRAAEAGVQATPIVERDYFRSIYFREPSGVLFELATDGPGFAIDEEPDALGLALRLPRQHEHLRELLDQRLVPIPDPWEPYR